MEFTFTAEQDQFRTELRAFLRERLPSDWKGVLGSNIEEKIEFTRSLCAELAERGWLTISWPTEYGGGGGDVWTQMVVREEMWSMLEPRGPQYMNLNYIGPMIMKFGTEEQRARFLPPMARGEVIWTQGFSEPEAGSDLASLRTRADRADAIYRVNGQKIWSSYASSPADWCLLLARTDPSAHKHAGISVFMVDMTSPGVTVRPIRSMAGMGEINEIFFDDVEVPAANRLGPENRGWPVILYGLSQERTGIALHARVLRSIERLVDYARTTSVEGRPLFDLPGVKTKIGLLYSHYRAARLLSYRVTNMAQSGIPLTAEAELSWIVSALTLQEVAEAGLEIAGASGQLMEGEADSPYDGAFEREWVEMLPITISGGTVDIQRLIVAQRDLGLPKAG